MTRSGVIDDGIWEVSISVESDDYPVQKGRVRGEVMLSGYLIKPKEQGNQNSVSTVFNVAYSDMKVPEKLKGAA